MGLPAKKLYEHTPITGEHKFLGTNKQDSTLALTFFVVSFIALLIGGILGLLQGLERAGVMTMPTWFDYYQTLTAHGFILIVVFTGAFLIGYLYGGVSHVLGGLLPKVRKMGWTSFGLITFGTVLTTSQVVIGEASVLYTFYPPMAASPAFYIGLVFIVLGLWTAAFGIFINVAHWRKNHKGQHIPLFAYFATGIFILLFGGTIGVTVEVFMLIPWALGWTETINVMLSRTLFWSFGHTLVNVWYLTAVSAWYVAVPKIIGGRQFSDTLARMVVFLLVIMNIPGGFHHQIVDPGFTEGLKYMHVFMSLAIGFPSLMTAFAMFATFERTGRKKGAKGLFGWVKMLPWKDVRFLAPFIAMVAFIPGGAGGIAQTNFQLNQVVHNTLFITGHFHITVGVSVALTFFGIAYWLVPHLSKRVMTSAMNKLAIIQVALWVVGMLIMSGAMHTVGLFGAPRRTAFTDYFDSLQAAGWNPYYMLIAIGGTLLIISVCLVVYIVFHLMFKAPKGETEFPIAEVEEDAPATPKWTERWSLWILIMVIVVSMGYVIPLVDLIVNAPPGSPPFKTW
ncbi:MAG TPA: cbb3-type cytochrome c oxidase subunit I [Candidatus Pseudogracilibacillus intestinigallinarum]|uniref:Cbb3-type cytochrome c oxidase subunit I n=1 Tax=Candidatus Pseudogracilibacillus intestinigallinarum TaxID=2838742 RepID=A0A9D1PMU9_9BACI|nr:cbb3-type cytochrome c oxidase subunit I [Candidatus Pseudogracilibacillus intestinigallinarum]